MILYSLTTEWIKILASAVIITFQPIDEWEEVIPLYILTTAMTWCQIFLVAEILTFQCIWFTGSCYTQSPKYRYCNKISLNVTISIDTKNSYSFSFFSKIILAKH